MKCAVLALGIPVAIAATPEPRNVLVVASRDIQQPSFEQFLSGFRPVANARGMELFVEFLDASRFPQPGHRQLMVRHLREKYQSTRIDLVVSTSPVALGFVVEHRPVLFPGAPHVFALVAANELPPQPLPNDSIGILDRFDAVKTLEMARLLQPSARRVVVVAGADAFDKMWEGIARRDLQPKFGEVEFTYLSGLPLPRLLEEVARLPPETMVLFLSVARDGAGRSFRSPDVAEQVAGISRAPLYVVFPSHFGRGPVGGYMGSFEAAGRQAAGIAARLLSGESPGQVRAGLGPESGAYVADWRQLQRFGLSESRLPPGSDVRFRELSAWQAYRWYLAGGIFLLVLQAALIVNLLWQRAGRRRAELELQRKRGELAHASALSMAGELSASISHEINQPLGAILSNADAAELLLESGTARLDEVRQILQDIRRDDLRASEVIGRMRRLLRKHEVELRPCYIDDVCGEVLKLVGYDAQRRSVELVGRLEGTHRVQADRIHLQQVLLNLILNAMDAVAGCPAERRQVTVSVVRSPDGVEVVVTDAGSGIALEAMAKLFDSFHSTKPHGMGLGLSIARSIIEAHGGRIWGRNNRGAPGAAFGFVLPAA